MKNLIYIISFIACLFLLASCNPKKNEWKGTIEEKAGVTIVKNPKKPVYRDNVFELQEDISIGNNEGNEEYVFSKIRIDVDQRGNLYVLDERASEIRVFDSNGMYIRNIGKFGQGPGEFQKPGVFIQHTINNEIAVFDISTKRIIFFTEMGEFVKQISTARILVLKKMIIHPSGIFILKNSPFQPLSDKLAIYDKNLEDSQVIFINQIEISPGNNIKLRSPEINFALKGNDVIWGYANKYQLNISDLNNNLKRKIMKNYIPIKISEYDIKELNEVYGMVRVGLIFPKHNPAFGEITTDEEGRIFVMTYERSKDLSNYYDVFNSEGKYIAKIPLSFRPYIWKNKNVYTIVRDDDGYRYIKRYKVTWNY